MAMKTPKDSLSDVGVGSVLLSLFGGKAGNAPEHARIRPKSRRLENIYLPNAIATLLLCLYGLIVVWSASLMIPEASWPRQLVGVVIGLLGAFFMCRYDYRNLANVTTLLLILDIVLMLLPKVPGLSYSAKGLTGWVQIPFIHMRFQPSELAKLVTVFLMAALGAQYNGKIETLKDYVRLCAYLLVPFALILTQPDLGTGLVILVSGAAIIICSGAKRSWVLVTIALIIAGSALIIITSMTPGLPHLLKPYQLNRLLVFVDPNLSPTDDGYNLLQSKIAVGSGGFFGKGIGNATQAGGGFLPEAHTDFVFALLSETFGFAGALVLLALYAVLIFSTIRLALAVEAPFGKLVLVGIVAMWSFQLLENMGMCIGIMPITGIPLPFISFGSSSMVAQLLAVGIVQSVYLHRTKAA